MNATARLFWILSGFFFLAAVVYYVWVLSYRDNGQATIPTEGAGVEWVGTVGLVLTGILSALIAFYVGRIYKSQGGELPEDRPNANIDDGDAEQGFFSPWSWWPVMLASGAALLVLGIAVGVWIAFIGAAFTAISLVGWTYEYYRGNFGR